MELIPYSISELSIEAYLIKVTTKSRMIYWLIIGFVIAAIMILPFIYADVSVQARGYFQSEIEKQIIYTPFQGKVSHISIHSGDKVKIGDTLIIIDIEAMRAQKASIMQSIAENDSSLLDLDKLTKINFRNNQAVMPMLVTQRYKAELENLRNQFSIQYKKYQKKNVENERNEVLYKQQLIPKAEYENSLFSLNSEKENLDQVMISQKSLWQIDLTNRRNESVKLSADLTQYSQAIGERIVLSTTDGEIIQSSDIQEGSIVTAGQRIAEISPEGDLIATCYVEPSDIGLIHERQRVKIQVDAYNYSEWGMLDGYIIDISDDMLIENGSKAYFRIKCKPEKTSLTLKNGVKADIRKGMSLNTRIIVIRRNLFRLLFDKADNWINPYTSVKN
jgi:membrane fusion protein, peptide pheromone/bacteriocin exporter